MAKIKGEPLRKLHKALGKCLEHHALHVSDVSTLCHAWQLLWQAHDMRWLNVADYYSDGGMDCHLDTALREYFPSIKRA